MGAPPRQNQRTKTKIIIINNNIFWGNRVSLGFLFSFFLCFQPTLGKKDFKKKTTHPHPKRNLEKSSTQLPALAKSHTHTHTQAHTQNAGAPGLLSSSPLGLVQKGKRERETRSPDLKRRKKKSKYSGIGWARASFSQECVRVCVCVGGDISPSWTEDAAEQKSGDPTE